MNFKVACLFAVALITGAAAHAQDRIFQSNGSVIRAKVVSVGTDEVVYKLWSHLDGPEYTISKNKVDKIKYEGGKQEWFTDREEQHAEYPNALRNMDRADRGRHNAIKFGTKMISFSPLQLSDDGFGFAFGYEGGIGKDGIVSYTLPIMTTFNFTRDYPYSYGFTSNIGGHEDAMFYFCPGIKFYPTSMFGKVKYSIGPSIVIGAGQQTTNEMIYAQPFSSSYNSYMVTRDKFLLGVTLVNSLNISPSIHYYMGVDYGVGFTYINQLDGQNKGMATINQFAFKLGYRF